MNGSQYYQLQVRELAKIAKLEKKPRLLLHSCCGPCNTYPMEYLSEYFDLTLFFNNHNIFPESEYTRRFEELEKYVDYFKQANNVSIDIVVPTYDNEKYSKLLGHRAQDKEGGPRCTMCFALRMREAMAYAAKHNYEYMTTVMTISRHKDSIVINKVGERLSNQFPQVKYLYSNFKKNNGYNRSIELSRKHNMYRQTYCGCQYSISCDVPSTNTKEVLHET